MEKEGIWLEGKETFDAITEVDDELVDEARTVGLKRESNHGGFGHSCRLPGTGAGHRSAYLYMAGNFFRKRFWWRQEPIMDVIYPKALAFEDTDGAWRSDENPVDEALRRL